MFSRPNATSFATAAITDLILRVLEDRGDVAGERCGRGLARVEPADDDAAREDAAVEVRHEPGERAQQRRLAAEPDGPSRATCSPSSIVSETPSSTGTPGV